MKLLPDTTDLSGMDCHLHSRFSPDAKDAGADSPEDIAAAVRKKGLRGFIVTDHIDIGHWNGCEPIDFDKYFSVWESVRAKNPDLTIYIGLEVGFEKSTAEQTAKLISELPLEYVINSVHYWQGPDPNNPTNHFSQGRIKAYTAYLNAVLASLDAPYAFNTIGHLGFPERYAPYDKSERAMEYEIFKPLMDEIIKKATDRRVRFEENTNAGGEMRLPRADFLKAYKTAGGTRPPLGSDAHVSASIGQHFKAAEKFLDDIFGNR
ncbi:MAG: histidinol-phosphatase HisJ family protein [Clostridiales bacterium]|nr:histidinol-phosphatase HisJ family protein [Clostridiales bacterium]